MTRRQVRRIVAICLYLLTAGALAAAVTACGGSGPGQPTSLVVLSNALTEDGPAAVGPGGAVQSLSSVSVTLAVGQSLGIRYTDAPLPQYWSQASGGDAQILRSDPVSTQSPCPSPVPAGCGPQLQHTYTALKAGTTRVVWQYGPCRKIVGNSVVTCPDVTKTVQVTVK